MSRISISLLVVSVALAIFAPHSSAQSWSGKCNGVSDGDTITALRDNEPVKIRLNGIDCPEKGQPFGARAKQPTSDMAFGKTVRIDPVTTDRYGRTVAWVSVNGESLNKGLVRAVLAWWYRKYARDDTELERLENEAREAKRGLWVDPNPVPPWEWRR